MSYLAPKAGNAKVWEVLDSPVVEPVGYVVAFEGSYCAYFYDDHKDLGSRRTLEDAHALVEAHAAADEAETAAHNARVEAILAAADAASAA